MRSSISVKLAHKIADEDVQYFKKYRKIFLNIDLFLLITFGLELLLLQIYLKPM